MTHPLVERWKRDADFRHAMRTAPAATVKRAGVPMSEEEWDALRALDWDLPDADLQLRLQSTFAPEDTRLVRP